MLKITAETDLSPLQKLPGIVRGKARNAVERRRNRMVRAVKAGAPDRSGNLKRKIKGSPVTTAGDIHMSEIYGEAFYTVYQERRLHFFEAVFDQQSPEAVEDAVRLVRSSIKEARR